MDTRITMFSVSYDDWFEHDLSSRLIMWSLINNEWCEQDVVTCVTMCSLLMMICLSSMWLLA